jgi:hypothetical protein
MAPPRPDPGATRAVEARGEPVVIRLGLQRMTQLQFSTDIQQVVTAFTKQQLSMETAGLRLFLSALEPDISGELFVTLTGGPTLTLVVVPAQRDRDLAVRVISPGAEASARAAEAAGLTPLRLMRSMILNLPPPGVSPRAGDGRIVYEDGALRLTLLATWTSPALEGIVLGAENLRALWIMLPLDRLAFLRPPMKRSLRSWSGSTRVCRRCSAAAAACPREPSAPDPVAEQMPLLAGYAAVSIQERLATAPAPA